MIRSLRSLLREDEVSHVAIAFDHVIKSFRNELFYRYKPARMTLSPPSRRAYLRYPRWNR
jgi:5'-3' exonuclease